MVKEIMINLLSSPVIWAMLFSFVLLGIGWIVTKTKTEKDDKIFKIVMGFIYNGFNVAEKAISDGTAGNLGKADLAMKEFIAQYDRRFGKYPDTDLQDLAKAEWAILATELKKSRS